MCTLEPCTLHKHIHIFCLPLHEWLELFTFTVHVYSMRKLTNCAQVHSSRNFFLFNLYSIHIAKCWIYIVINPLDEHETKNWKKKHSAQDFYSYLIVILFLCCCGKGLNVAFKFLFKFHSRWISNNNLRMISNALFHLNWHKQAQAHTHTQP